MRSWQALAMVAMVAGCASEQGIYGGVDPDGAGTELGDPDDGRPGDDDDDWSASTDPFVEAGAVEGRVCAPDGETYLSLATVTVLTDYGNVTGLTDGEGYFLIDAIPVGTWPIIVEKGSFSVSHEVTIEAGQRTSLATEVCVPLDPGTVDIAVVTGSYDSIEDVLDVLAIDSRRGDPALRDLSTTSSSSTAAWVSSGETTRPRSQRTSRISSATAARSTHRTGPTTWSRPPGPHATTSTVTTECSAMPPWVTWARSTPPSSTRR